MKLDEKTVAEMKARPMSPGAAKIAAARAAFKAALVAGKTDGDFEGAGSGPFRPLRKVKEPPREP